MIGTTLQGKATFILETFLSLVKESNFNFFVTETGDFIFEDKKTGQRVMFEKEEMLDYYGKL